MATDPSQLLMLLAQHGGLNGVESQQYAQQAENNDLAQQQAQQQLQEGDQKIAATDTANAQAQVAQQKMAAFGANPNVDTAVAAAVANPQGTDSIQKIWGMKEDAVKQADLNTIGPAYAALTTKDNAGDPAPNIDGAVQTLQTRADAEDKAGIDSSELKQQIAALKSGDPASVKNVEAQLFGHLALSGKGPIADAFAKKLAEAQNSDTKGTVVGRAIGHYDNDGKWVVDYRDPESAQYRTIDGVDQDGNPIKQLVQVGGGTAPGTPASAPASTSGNSTGSPLAVRLNNPGAIRYDPKNQWQGQVGQQNGFAQFDTPANGQRAHRILIANQIKEGYDTPAAWAAHYAPAGDGNDPASYAQTVASGLGIGVNDKIPLNAVPKMASLSAQVEAGGSPPAGASAGAAPTAIVGSPSAPGVKVLYTSKTPGTTGLDAGTIDFYGQKVAAGGDMPQFGMGKQAAAMRQAVLARSAQIQQSQGMSGGDSNLLHADVKTATTALGALQKTRNSLNPFLQTFDGASAQVRQLAPQGVGGSAPIFNRWIQAGRTSVSGDPAVSKFNVAINAVANENAKIMSGASGGAVSSDSARAEAMHLINNAQTLDQLNGTLDQMHTDTQIRVKSLDDRQAQLRNIIAGKGSGSSTTASQTAPNSTAAPRVGSVARGFRFNGGNPADRNNWVKVQ